MQRRNYYRANKEHINAARRAERAADPEKLRNMAKKWRKEHRAKYLAAHNASTQRRRMAKMNIPGSHTLAEWEELCAKFKYRCVKCGERKPLTRDHVIPITKPGSTHFITNIQPLCRNLQQPKKK
jgi:5-methylcytosine-specific restriction endonuclease McrA